MVVHAAPRTRRHMRLRGWTLKKLRAIVRPSCRPAKAPALAPREPDPVACRPLPGPPPPNVEQYAWQQWHQVWSLCKDPQFVPGPLKPGTPNDGHKGHPKFQGAPGPATTPEQGTRRPRNLDLRVPKTPPEPAPRTPEEPVPSNFKQPTAHYYGMSGGRPSCVGIMSTS